MEYLKKYQSILERTSLFGSIPSDELQALLSCLAPRVQQFAANGLIFAEGSPAGQMGLVLHGSVQIVQEDFYGNRHIIAALGPGELFAEAFACAGIASLPVSVFAVQECTVLLLDAARILRPCQNACRFHQKAVLNLLQSMASRNLQMNQKLWLLSRKTTQQKLMAYFSAQAKAAGSREFSIPFNRQQLADYLGVERSAMCCELSKLQSKGCLTARKNSISLLREWEE